MLSRSTSRATRTSSRRPPPRPSPPGGSLPFSGPPPRPRRSGSRALPPPPDRRGQLLANPLQLGLEIAKACRQGAVRTQDEKLQAALLDLVEQRRHMALV